MNVCINAWKSCFLACFIGLSAALLCLTPAGQYLEEEYGLSWLFKLRGEVPAPEEVVIVSIDQTSSEILRLPDDPEKWPRFYYAQLLDNINLQKPAIIALNIVFNEARKPENDMSLARAISASNNVILSNYLKRSSISKLSAYGGQFNQFNYESLIDPIPLFEQASIGVSPFLLPKTSSTVKQFWTYKASAGDIPTFPISIFQSYVLSQTYQELTDLFKELEHNPVFQTSANLQQGLQEDRAIESQIKIRTEFSRDPRLSSAFDHLASTKEFSTKKKQLLKSWTELMKNEDSLYFNHYGPVQTITTIPFYQALASRFLAPDFFTDKVVFIGFSEDILPEKNPGFYTVFSAKQAETTSSIEIAATAVSNLIENNWLRPISLQNQFIMIFLWSCLLAMICGLFSYKKTVFIILLLTLLYFGTAYFRFITIYSWMPVFIPVAIQPTIILSIATWYHFQTNKKQYRNMQTAFGYYLPNEVVHKISGKPESDAMDGYGELKHGVCLATDASQYTTLSETLEPFALNDLMNRYYAVVFPPVNNSGGIISDVIGDAVLAIWATPTEESKPRNDACRAALKITQAVSNFNQSQSFNLPIRIGLHYGSMRLGNVGAVEHYEYRAIGDVVNTATRIEGLNKILGTTILASETTVSELSGIFTRQVGTFLLKGKKVPITIVELIGLQNEVTPEQQTLAKEFQTALEYFKDFQLHEAHSAFMDLIRKFPEDGPTCFYINYFNQNPALLKDGKQDTLTSIINTTNLTDLLQSRR